MSKEYSPEEIAEHNDKDSCWLVMDDKVYDVTPFLNEHPGGEEVLLDGAGQDVTEAFNDVGHSDEAVGSMDDFLIGKLGASDGKVQKPALKKKKKEESGNLVTNFIAPVIIIGLAIYFAASRNAASN